MSNKNLAETIKAQIKADSSQYKVFNLLSDQEWHCRDCEGKLIGSSQYSVYKKGAEAEEGCVGCGWYDFAAWRNALNQKLAAPDND